MPSYHQVVLSAIAEAADRLGDGGTGFPPDLGNRSPAACMAAWRYIDPPFRGRPLAKRLGASGLGHERLDQTPLHSANPFHHHGCPPLRRSLGIWRSEAGRVLRAGPVGDGE